MEIKKSIEQGFAGGGLYDILLQLKNGMLPISGKTYYVSKQGNGTTGESWENAFTTIASAITASNAYIALSENQYRRNRMYIDGGGLWQEVLATLPNQCDMVGVGARTGWKPTIYGRVNVTTAVLGCHIYNIMFYNPTTSVPVIIIPAGSHGFEFHHCQIVNGDGLASTVGIQSTDSNDFVIDDCTFHGNPPCVTGISLAGTSCINGKITNNFISATTNGILVANGMTGDYGLLIRGNAIARQDPNTDTQMTYGIRYADTNSRIHSFICENFISATTYISHVGGDSATALANATIGNRYTAGACLLYTSPSPRDGLLSRMPSSA